MHCYNNLQAKHKARIEVALRVRDVKHAFTNKLGAELDDSGNHIYFYLDYGSSQFTVGKLSHSWRGNLNDTQIRMLAHKLYLQKREFERWVACTVTTEKMIELWQTRRTGLA